MKKLISSLSAALFSVLLLFPAVAHASTVQLYLSPASQSVQVNNTFSVKVYVNTDQYMGYVKADLKFTSSKLHVTSLSTAGSAYPNEITQTYSNANGTINIERSGGYAPGSAQLVGTITFKGIAAGTATVSFAGSSKVSYTQYNANALSSTSSGTYTITSPPVTTCPAGQIGTPPNCTTPSTGGGGGSTGGSTGGSGGSTGGSTGGNTGGNSGGSAGGSTGSTGSDGNTNTSPNNTPPNNNTNKPNPNIIANTPLAQLLDPNKLNISDQAVDVNYNSGTIMWKTNFPSPSKVEYGLDANNLDGNQSFLDKITDHTVSLVNLVPGKRYYYRISASADNGQTATYEDQFHTKGFPVNIAIATPDKKPVKNARVTIDGEQFTTDKNGVVETNLSAENHSIVVSANHSTKNYSINVENKDVPTDGSDPEVQSFTYTVPKASNMLLITGGIVGVLAFIAAGAFLLLKTMKHLRKKQPKKTKKHASGSLPLVHKELIVDQPAVAMPKHTPPPSPLPEIPHTPEPVPPEPKQLQPQPVPLPPEVPTSLPPLHEDLPHMVARANAAKSNSKQDDFDEPKDMFELAEEQYHYNEKFKKK